MKKTPESDSIYSDFSIEGVSADDRQIAPARRAASSMTAPELSDIPVHGRADVLVVGGGPSGCAAAAAAAQLGAEVILVERYGHLGGLSTGGLVVWIDRMTNWSGQQVITGFANELLGRLPSDAIVGPPPELWGSTEPKAVAYWSERSAAFRNVVTWSPMIDPEWLKIVSQQLVIDRGVKLMLHAWAVAPIVEDGRIRGCVFESKEGRQVIHAGVVVDATGDGDLFALAGAEFESDIDATDIHHRLNVAFLFAGVDMERWLTFKVEQPQQFSEFMRRGAELYGHLERAHVSWRNDVALFMGPRLSGFSALKVDDLTAVEIRSRALMVEHLAYYREHAPGFEGAWVMLTAPQIGTRHSRRLVGTNKVAKDQWERGTRFNDEIAVSPSPSPKFADVSVPFGSLVPRKLGGLLVSGRHISCDPQSHTFMREIPQCWATGQAAGVAAALAARQDVDVRNVDVTEVQRTLVGQGAFVRRPGDQVVIEQRRDTVPAGVAGAVGERT